MEKHRLILWLIATLWCPAAFAQSEGGLLLEVAAEKKLTNRFSLSLDADMRTRNNFTTMDRWSVGLQASYKFTKWLKAVAGYTLLNTNFREDTEDYISSKGNAKTKWRPSYWGVRHRFTASLTGSYKLSDDFKVSLRERWQYTYRPAKATERYKMDTGDQEGMELDEDYVRKGKGKNQLRSRLLVEYDKKHALLAPYASVEMYNSWAVEKLRYTVGTDIRLSKQHTLGLFYRFQDMKQVDADDYDPDMHYIGLSYKLKF